MLGGRSWDEWISRDAASHQHPLNRFCHTVGIPLIVASLPLFLAALLVDGFWPVPLTLFAAGWVLQFIGHAVFEKSKPSFFGDAYSLLIGPVWVTVEWLELFGLPLPALIAPAPEVAHASITNGEAVAAAS